MTQPSEPPQELWAPQLDRPTDGSVGGPVQGPRHRWRTHILLFVATLVSVFIAGALQEWPADVEFSWLGLLRHLPQGWTFAVPLMAILLTHEFGHYFAARWHRVPASLPYFIPLPVLSPFGTMGALISMPGRIRSRNALLDIGASGPLAGLVVSIVVLAVGLAQSPVHEVTGHGWIEGQCLLYSGLKWLVLGTIPAGHDVYLTPTAFAGWAGLLVTTLNMLPIGQLDGGHIAYALLGKRQNRVATVLLVLLPGVFLYNYLSYRQVEPGLVWLVWFVLLLGLRRMAGGNHPPTEPGELSPARRWIGIGCAVLFVLLFMPTPMRAY